MLDINPRINLLRLRLQQAEHLYRSDETHNLLGEALGPIWDDAIGFHEGNKTEAARFLLKPYNRFDGNTAFDTILEGDEGLRKYNEFFKTLHLSHQ